jgi:hypothetical protein
MAVLSVSLQKVGGLVEVFEDEVFSQFAIRAGLPATKLGERLLSRESLAGTECVQVLCKHLLIIYN